MRAVVVHEFGPPSSLRLEHVSEPVPGSGELVVTIEATAVNYVDLLVISGKYQFLPPRPFTPGKLPAGRVSAVGPGTTDFAVGDRVLTTVEHGGYAEKVCVPASACYRIPDEMPAAEAASMALAFDTAWFALKERARLKGGESVLVLGATGSVGIAAVQLAKAFGAHVIAGVSSLDKAQGVRDMGADAIVDLSVPDTRNSLREQVRAANGGSGVDVVIDPLGDKFFEAALRSLDWCGRLVVIGFAAGEIPTIKANYLLVKNIEVSGLQVSDYRKRMPDRMAECFADIFNLYCRGRLSAPPLRTIPLEGFADALDQIQDRRAGARLVLTPVQPG